MNQATLHRGPDATAIWEGQGITFGHNRLAIIDLSERGSQPMWDSEHEVVIVYNGELYNFKELRQKLSKKYTFQSESDTEVIICAYKEYGVDCVKHFNGVFAFAIWDTRTQELFLARDQVGVNPLYYYADSSANLGQTNLIFSSEIKAILEHEIPRVVDNEAFNFYMQLLYVPTPYTMFKDIHKLPPASYLVWKNGKYSITTYWQVTDFSNLSSRVEACKQIKDLFRDSVKHQLISDRPVGVFLSGGVDSTAVLGVAKEFHAGQIKTFSVGFKDSTDPTKFNADFELARKTATYYGTDHQELMIGPDDIQDNLEKIVWHLDEPNSNPTAGAMFLLSERAKHEVAVVLGGDGGDELFGGYPRYYYSRLISTYQRLPRMLQLSSLRKFKLAPGAERVVAFLGQKSEILSQVVKSKILQSDGESYIQEHYLSVSDKQLAVDFEKYFMNVDRQSWLVDESLLRTNKMCLAWGLEPRVPILDYRLVELANRIPTAWKLSIWKHRPSQFQGKDIWQEAIEDYLPAHILHQQKRGWFTPMAKWLRTSKMRDYVSDILSPGRLNAEFFNVNEIQKIWHDHLESKQYNLSIIWAIVMWQLWYEKFIKE